MAVLMLAAGLWWWFWPRGDARFVGTWQQGTSLGVLRHSGWKITFFQNGTVAFNDLKWLKNCPIQTWRVQGSHLIYGSRLPFSKSRFSRWLVTWMRQRTGMEFWGEEVFARIVKLTDDEIRLDLPDSLGIDILVRIPE